MLSPKDCSATHRSQRALGHELRKDVVLAFLVSRHKVSGTDYTNGIAYLAAGSMFIETTEFEELALFWRSSRYERGFVRALDP